MTAPSIIDQCIYQTHQIVTLTSEKMFYIYFISCYFKRPIPRVDAASGAGLDNYVAFILDLRTVGVDGY